MSTTKCGPDKEKWSQAISDAETLLTKFQRKVIRLRCAIELFKEYRDAGESWSPEKADAVGLEQSATRI